MSELSYNLFHQRTAENIRVELERLRESLLKGEQIKPDIKFEITSLNSLLADSILDFKRLST